MMEDQFAREMWFPPGAIVLVRRGTLNDYTNGRHGVVIRVGDDPCNRCCDFGPGVDRGWYSVDELESVEPMIGDTIQAVRDNNDNDGCFREKLSTPERVLDARWSVASGRWYVVNRASDGKARNSKE